MEDLHSVNGHPVSRRFIKLSGECLEQLHGLCNASSVAYGVAIYLRAEHEDGSISTSLVTAKARVLPVHPVTIPKAELLGAHLLARLLHHTCSVLEIPLCRVFAWTDSEIVLHWIPKAPPQLDRFVANRVYGIQQLLPSVSWRHVPTDTNPADLASRGVRAPDLAKSALWWSGPPWLSLQSDQWPTSRPSKPSVPTLVASIRASPSPTHDRLDFIRGLWSKFSCFFNLVRMLSLVFRFMFNCRLPPSQRLTGPPTFEEIERSKFTIYRLAQSEHYDDVLTSLQKNSTVPRNHKLARYNLTLSRHGHILAQSRVRSHTAYPTDRSELQVTTYEVHAGVSAMLSILCHTYLILALRNLLKLISRTCVVCQRAYARPLAHSMGILPSSRITPAPPFSRTGIDFAGPFHIKKGHTRRPVILNTYAVVFVCLTTKAVHFDLCASLSTEDFLAVLRRFVARRGCPQEIFSDNGTNFSGAREEIRALHKLAESEQHLQAISNFAITHSFKWSHIPPRAPHFGGLWEAAIRAMKIALRKIATAHPMMWEEMYTVLIEAEGMLNSRPLAPMSSDEAEEGSFLTVGHFLIGRPIQAQPSRQPSTGQISLLKRWNLVSRIRSDLWKTWSSSYLSSCAQRSRWTHSDTNYASET